MSEAEKVGQAAVTQEQRWVSFLYWPKRTIKKNLKE